MDARLLRRLVKGTAIAPLADEGRGRHDEVDKVLADDEKKLMNDSEDAENKVENTYLN